MTVNGVDLKISYVGGAGGYDVTLNAPSPTAARLAYLRAAADGAGQINLSWGTLVEGGTLGFQVDRAAANGAWERVTAQLIPATGWDQRPQTYALTEVSPTGTAGAKYRLLEVDQRGREIVLAETAVSAGAAAWIERRPEGLRLSLEGSPGTTLVIEASADVARGPWVEAGTVELDAAGQGVLSLGGDTAEPARFYRWKGR